RIGSRNTAHHLESPPASSPGTSSVSAIAGSGFPKNETLGSIGSGGSKSGPEETQPQTVSRANAAANIPLLSVMSDPGAINAPRHAHPLSRRRGGNRAARPRKQ